MSLQRPLEETSLTKEVHVDMHQQHSVGAESEMSAEALMPMEESHLAPSVAATSTVVTAFSTPQGMVTSMVSEFSSSILRILHTHMYIREIQPLKKSMEAMEAM